MLIDRGLIIVSIAVLNSKATLALLHSAPTVGILGPPMSKKIHHGTQFYRAPVLPQARGYERSFLQATSIWQGDEATRTSSRDTTPTAVYALLMANLVLFVADKIFRLPFIPALYLYHSGWAWWQPITACFCHGSRSHLSGNAFLLLIFGRSVEDDLGWGGLLLSYIFCGVFANLVSLLLLPSTVVSIGASGAVFGLFAVSVLSRLTWNDTDWRKIIEMLVLGEFVFGRVISEMQTAATGGVPGINHVAHLSGLGAGILLVLGLRAVVTVSEKKLLGTK